MWYRKMNVRLDEWTAIEGEISTGKMKSSFRSRLEASTPVALLSGFLEGRRRSSRIKRKEHLMDELGI